MRIIIVGVCAAGKTSLAQKLRQLGYNADTVAQEHSYVPTMWRHTSPDVLVFLDASLNAIRKRRDIDWGEDYLAQERLRLADARQHCHLYVMTDKLKEDQVYRRVRRFLEKYEAELSKKLRPT
jgi:adenylate kinase